VAESIERKSFNVRDLTRLRVLLLESGFLKVAAAGARRKNPGASGGGSADFENSGGALAEWDRPSGIGGLSERHVDRAFPDVLPLKSETLLRP
jgi:hypothetical protein